MIQQEDKEKMEIFVERLFDKDNLKNETPANAEQQILSFFVQNEANLKNLFNQPSFFQHLEWKEIKGLFVQVVNESTIEKMKPLVKRILEKTIDFSVIQDMNGAAQPPEIQEKTLQEFIISQLENMEFKNAIDSQFKLFLFKFIDKYLLEIFNRKTYVYNELVKVDRMKLDPVKYADYLKIAIILKNFIFVPFQNVSGQNLTFEMIKKNKKLSEKVLKTKRTALVKKFMDYNKKIINVGLNANLDCKVNTEMEGAAKLLSIFSKRAIFYNPQEKLDRGAEYPDKSWFSTVKRNASFHGFDKKMLEELFFIAADFQW